MHYYLQAHTKGKTKNAHKYLITLSSFFFYIDESPLCSLDGSCCANNQFNQWLANPCLCNHDRHQLRITVENGFRYQKWRLLNMSSGTRTHRQKRNHGHKFPLELRTSMCLNEMKREGEM